MNDTETKYASRLEGSAGGRTPGRVSGRPRPFVSFGAMPNRRFTNTNNQLKKHELKEKEKN